MKTFEELGVSPEIRKAIEELGYENPMPVQEEGDSMKLDSLVIAHQPRRGEYVPGPCTHRPSSHGSRGYLKYVTARSVLG